MATIEVNRENYVRYSEASLKAINEYNIKVSDLHNLYYKYINTKLQELNNDFEWDMNMTLKEEMEFELRFFKKCFDEILKNNSDYSTKIYRKNSVLILSIIETLD